MPDYVVVIEQGNIAPVVIAPDAIAPVVINNGGATDADSLGQIIMVFPFAYNDVAQRVVFTLDKTLFILSATLSVNTPFNGTSPSLSVGTSNAPALFIAPNENDPKTAVDYTSEINETFAQGTQIVIATAAGAGGTSGGGNLILELANL